MATTSKSPRQVVLAALATARRSLPAYTHRYSPKVFTQHQLFACLVLKNFLKTDYRGIVAHLADHPTLVEVMELKRAPHFTTLQKTARRLLAAKSARHLLDGGITGQVQFLLQSRQQLDLSPFSSQVVSSHEDYLRRNTLALRHRYINSNTIALFPVYSVALCKNDSNIFADRLVWSPLKERINSAINRSIAVAYAQFVRMNATFGPITSANTNL